MYKYIFIFAHIDYIDKRKIKKNVPLGIKIYYAVYSKNIFFILNKMHAHTHLVFIYIPYISYIFLSEYVSSFITVITYK